MLDIAERSAAHQKAEQRRAELDARERAHGGTVPGDRAAEQRRSALKGWGPYKPEKPADIRAGIAGVADARVIKEGRLWIDCGRAVSRWCAALSSDDRATVQSDAFSLLVAWPSHGGGKRKDGSTAPTLDLGGLREQRRARLVADHNEPTRARAVLKWIDYMAALSAEGSLPLRRDWIDPTTTMRERGMTEQPSAAAWRALHAAVKQSAARADATPTPKQESPTDPLDIAALVEIEQQRAAELTRLPDNAAPELLARLLDTPLDAARAIVARAYPHATPTELATAWRISRDAVPVALSRGAAALRKQWPMPNELLDAIDAAAAKYRAETEQNAALALLDYRAEQQSAPVVERIFRSRAADAVAEWRGCTVGMPADALALLSAARCGLRRHAAVNGGATYGSERAENISGTVARLYSAERRAARRSTRARPTAEVHKYALSAQRVDAAKLDDAALRALSSERAESERELQRAEMSHPHGCNVDRLRELRGTQPEPSATQSAERGHPTAALAPIDSARRAEQRRERAAVSACFAPLGVLLPLPRYGEQSAHDVLRWIALAERCAECAEREQSAHLERSVCAPGAMR